MLEIKNTELVEFKDLDNLDVFELNNELYLKITEFTAIDWDYPAQDEFIVKSKHIYNAIKLDNSEYFCDYVGMKSTDEVRKLNAQLIIKR